MPTGMCLRSNWGASHIADPKKELSLDSYCSDTGTPCPKPIPLNRFVDYGHWYQRRAVPDLDRRMIHRIEADTRGFKVITSDEEAFTSKRVVIATGIDAFAGCPPEFSEIPSALASHSSAHDDLAKFKGRSIVVIGAGQSALESAVLCREAGAEVEVIARKDNLNWVGMHPRLHHLGPVSQVLYSNRDVGPAGISRLVAAPHLFRMFPRWFQDPVTYRAIRPAVAGWLQPRLTGLPITLGRQVTSAIATGSQLRLKLDDHTERLVDHALLATGYRVDVSRYQFLSEGLLKRLKSANGYPVLGRGLECSVPGLHFLGKPAAWSFGPIVGFVSGAEFVAKELVRSVGRNGYSPSEGSIH